MSDEPPNVQEARRVLREWELRDGHHAYAEPLDGGWRGYQGRCWDCDWHGPEYLRGDEEMGTEESRQHKENAHRDAARHRAETKPRGGCMSQWRSEEIAVVLTREEAANAAIILGATLMADWPDETRQLITSGMEKLETAAASGRGTFAPRVEGPRKKSAANPKESETDES